MFPMFDPDRHWGCRVNDRVTWNGMRALILQNELLQIVVLVDKGSEIISFLYKPLDVDFLWRNANPLRNVKDFNPAGASASAAYFDRWSGGWIEVLPNGGPSCSYRGAEFSQFSETVNVPWEYRILEDTPEQVTVALWIQTYRTPFLLQKTLTLKRNQPALYIQETVANQGTEPVDFMWGHHPVVGAPFLDASCRLYAPPCKVEIFHDEDGPDHRMGLHQVADWPIIQDRDGRPLDLRHIPGPESRTMDNCYLKDFEDGWIAVCNTGRKVGFGLAWDPQAFKYIWVWQALGGGLGYPWYGRTYNLGIEPWTSYPCFGLEEVTKRGAAARLNPGTSLSAWLTAVAFTGKDEVTGITREGEVL